MVWVLCTGDFHSAGWSKTQALFNILYSFFLIHGGANCCLLMQWRGETGQERMTTVFSQWRCCGMTSGCSLKSLPCGKPLFLDTITKNSNLGRQKHWNQSKSFWKASRDTELSSCLYLSALANTLPGQKQQLSYSKIKRNIHDPAGLTVFFLVYHKWYSSEFPITF